MKVDSISGIKCYVDDLSRTAEFYEALGFRRGKEESDRVTFYVNWFFVTFVARDRENDAKVRKGAKRQTKEDGLFLNVKVADIEDFHKAVLSKGMNPEGQPQAQSSGNLEFILRDPDGYQLAFFQKK